MRRVVGFLVTFESLFALDGIFLTVFGTVEQFIAPHLIWVLIATPMVVGFIPWGLRLYRERQRSAHVADVAVVDYMAACDIANRYIDPDLTMPDGKRIAVRSQILARFEKVGGAMVGEKYNGQLLHRWLRDNAARALVGHQDEIA